MRTSRGASAREVGSEDGELRTGANPVRVGRVEGVVRRGRVLRRERRWATGGAIRTVRGPVSAQSVGCRQDGPNGRAACDRYKVKIIARTTSIGG